MTTSPYWVLKFPGGAYLIDTEREFVDEEAVEVVFPDGSPTWAPTPYRERASRYFSLDEVREAREDFDWPYGDRKKAIRGLKVFKVTRKEKSHAKPPRQPSRPVRSAKPA